MNRIRAGIAIGILALASTQGRVIAQTERSGELVKVSERIWAWQGAGPATGVLFAGERESLVYDPGGPHSLRELIRAAGEVTSSPIRWAVVGSDQAAASWGGLCWAERPFKLLVQAQTRRSLAERAPALLASLKESRDSDDSWGSPADKAYGPCRLRLPGQVIFEGLVLDLGGHPVEIIHSGDGRLAVWSARERVLAAGDALPSSDSYFVGERPVTEWLKSLDRLRKLDFRRVICAESGPVSRSEYDRYRRYLAGLIAATREELSKGTPPEAIPARAQVEGAEGLRENPDRGATLSANIEAALADLLKRPPQRGERAGFTLQRVILAGRNPHQIAFSPDGARAFVAAAASNWIAEIDVRDGSVLERHAAPDTPLGVAVFDAGSQLLVSRFGADRIDRYRLPEFEAAGHAATGDGPSLFAGPLPDGRYMISIERADRLRLIDPRELEFKREFAVGRRPFPPSATSDGRLAFVPNYDDGSVTAVDLWNERVLESVAVGAQPSGGAVLPGDMEYAVAVRGEDHVALVNTASRRVAERIRLGIGDSPFSLVLSPNGRLAFVNNTASHDVSVIDLDSRHVIARLPVGEIPIVMAVHPSGESLWVASEGSHEVSVFEIPESWRRVPTRPGAQAETEVAVLGMIHNGHRSSRLWGLKQVAETIRSIAPDVVCVELPPDRWRRVWKDYAERGVVEDSRARVFPEYVDMLLPLKLELGFQVEPCAAWTSEMAALRRERIRRFDTDPAWSQRRAEYERRRSQVAQSLGDSPRAEDDPRFIHSDRYDRRTEQRLSVYDEFLNEWIGPGGWTNINEAHMRLIDRAIDRHPGKRILITFGAGHKYWFLSRLRERRNVRLLDVLPHLPQQE